MTRILYWNIQQFSKNKVSKPSNTVIPGYTKTYGPASDDLLQMIVAVIRETAADIVSIVELQTAKVQNSDLATEASALTTAETLVNALNARRLLPKKNKNDPNKYEPDQNWRLVPPLWLGFRKEDDPASGGETVAVLYRGKVGSVVRYFTGPNYWSDGKRSINPQLFPGHAQPKRDNYPRAFADLIKHGKQARKIPAADPTNNLADPQYNSGKLETQSAARIFYKRNITSERKRREMEAEAAEGRGGLYRGFRPPYMTTFYEKDTQGKTARNLTIFSVHSPPNIDGASFLIKAMSRTEEIRTSPVPAQPGQIDYNETKVICGDFNLPFLNFNGNYSRRYDDLTMLGYHSLLPTNIMPPNMADDLKAFRGYFATHIGSTGLHAGFQIADLQNTRLLWSVPANPQAMPPTPRRQSFYPGYGYTTPRQNLDSIDNILVWPRMGPQNPLPITIINLVTGVPFNQPQTFVLPPELLGAVTLKHKLGAVPRGAKVIPPNGMTPEWPARPAAADFNPMDADALLSWDNYGKILRLSDHFALLTEI